MRCVFCGSTADVPGRQCCQSCKDGIAILVDEALKTCIIWDRRSEGQQRRRRNARSVSAHKPHHKHKPDHKRARTVVVGVNSLHNESGDLIGFEAKGYPNSRSFLIDEDTTEDAARQKAIAYRESEVQKRVDAIRAKRSNAC